MSPYKCAYCQSNTHLIHHCKDPSIEKLHEETMEFVAVSNYAYFDNLYIPCLLKTYTTIQLRVLGYKFRIKLTSNGEATYKHFIAELAEKYYESIYDDAISIRIIRGMTESRLETCLELAVKYYMYNFPDGDDVDEDIKDYTRRYIYELRPNSFKYDIVAYLDETGVNTGINVGDNCSICLEKMEKETLEFDCKHAFCTPCVMQYFEKLNIDDPTCPLCRNDIFAVKSSDRPSVKQFMYKWCKHQVNLVVEQHVQPTEDEPSIVESEHVTDIHKVEETPAPKYSLFRRLLSFIVKPPCI